MYPPEAPSLRLDELKDLWQGMPLKNAEGHTVIVRAALLCYGCDIPAARKVCGFVETWKSLSVIDSKTFDAIQRKVDSFVSPPDIGRVP